MKKYNRLLLLFLIGIFSCKRIVLSPYLGDFSFTIYEETYTLGIPTSTRLLDTFTYEGEVRRYEEKDDFLATNPTKGNSSSKITIHFNSLDYITPEIAKKGKFVTVVSGHKSLLGEFVDKDSLIFTLSNGGIGYTHSYKVIGIRK